LLVSWTWNWRQQFQRQPLQEKKFASNWFSFVILHEATHETWRKKKKVIEYREMKTRTLKSPKSTIIMQLPFFPEPLIIRYVKRENKIVIKVSDYINLCVSVSFYVLEKIKHNGAWIMSDFNLRRGHEGRGEVIKVEWIVWFFKLRV
jgi:hypothetical protein